MVEEELAVQGRVKPVIAHRIPLAEVARTHELVESGVVEGKIILTCDAG